RLGVAIRNFGLDGRPSGEVSYLDLQNGEPVTVTGDEFARVTPPTTFLLGVSTSRTLSRAYFTVTP
ncbi:MAG: hypothetical protein AAFP18_18705, partial [Bacteroidota bacterium]